MRIVFSWLQKPENINVFNAVRKMVLSAGLPFEPAKVNKNWPRLAYGPAPAQGQQAEREYLDIYLQTPLSADEVRRSLQAVAPKGMELLQVERVPYPLPSVQNLAAAARYRVKGDFVPYHPGRKLEDFLAGGRICVARIAANGMRYEKDLSEYVGPAETIAPNEVVFTLRSVEGKWIQPQELIAAWLGIELPAEDEAPTVAGLIFIREGLFWQDCEGNLHIM